jgi:hypothetical protein
VRDQAIMFKEVIGANARGEMFLTSGAPLTVRALTRRVTLLLCWFAEYAI